MDFDALARQWHQFGETDPLWAILTDPTRKGNRWDPEAFFETGRSEIAQVVARARGIGVPHRWARGLDFGCGVGRLTQALAEHVDHTIGLDIAPSMIELARRFNRHGERCHYDVNNQPSLEAWPSACFDVIYCCRVLQHMEPVYAAAFINEFVRVLAPGGYLVFDIPSEHGFFPLDSAAETDVGLASYRADVTIVDGGPITVAAGATLSIVVEVTNRGSRTWVDDAHPLNVGNHWLAGDGTLITRDDRRVAVPMPWGPGETARVVLETVVPTTYGRYRLQCDVVEEGRTWFADVGSTLAEVEVIVGDASTVPASPSLTPAEPEPVMEMHAIPRATVEGLLGASGATVLAVTRVEHCGPAWLTYRYDVTKT